MYVWSYVPFIIFHPAALYTLLNHAASLDTPPLPQEEISELQRELRLMATCDHDNIISFYGGFRSKQTIWVRSAFHAHCRRNFGRKSGPEMRRPSDRTRMHPR